MGKDLTIKIKICGITNLKDALAAVEYGADALGFIFHPASPRFVSIERTAEISKAVPATVKKFGVFVDADQATMDQHLEALDLDVLQFHGNETEAEILAVYQRNPDMPKKYIKAIRMKPGLDLELEMAKYPLAYGFLLDTYQSGVQGGTGEPFDWSAVPQNSDKPICLAGGLTPENVADAIAQTHPYAVDAVSGVEASKGVKDLGKLKAFCDAVKGASND